MTIKYLFMFENENNAIVEIKRKDQPEDTPKDQVYFWLMVNKNSKKVEKLDFISMIKEPKQIREFKQGMLSFDEKNAFYNNESFNNIKVDDLDISINDIISNYFLSDKKIKKLNKKGIK